jgi:murein DD-endopeptidase MepM/ murein hydrolase activator NlpD
LIRIGQVLRVPVGTGNIAPGETLLPDSEVVYGPGYVDFDIAGFIADQQGYLASYTEIVEGQTLTGAEIVKRVAEQFSVGPRVLLALLEHYGGWVTNPTVTEAQLNGPLGPHNPRGGSLYLALGFTANRINAGYYGYKRDGFWVFHLADRGQAITPQGVNAGTVGIQNILAIHSDFDTWQQEVSQDGFVADYRALFDDPFAQEFAPIMPIDLIQPALSLPWAVGQGFYYTSGPHGAFADGSAWSAVDFGPPDVLGNCFYSKEPSTAAAPGVVVAARQGEVHLDLDGDGQIQTGWVLQYLHVALDVDNPVQVGQTLATGDTIGYASCEGGLANSSHLHFARRFNGEWIEAGGPVPMNLSGWIVQPNLTPYDGAVVKAGQERIACECWEPDLNLVVNEETE